MKSFPRPDALVETAHGGCIERSPESERVEAWLLATRHTLRDYLDTVVLFERLGEGGAEAALRAFDEIYRQPGGTSALAEVAERLAAAVPSDRAMVDLKTYRG